MTREVYFEDKPCLFCEFCREPTTMTLIKGTEKTKLDEHPLYDAFQMSAKYVCDKCKTQYVWEQTFVQNTDVGGETFEKDNSAARDKCIDVINGIMDEYDEALGAFRLSFMNSAKDDMEMYFNKIKNLRFRLDAAKVNLVSLYRSCEDCGHYVPDDHKGNGPECSCMEHCCEKGVCQHFCLNDRCLDEEADQLIKCAKLEEE